MNKGGSSFAKELKSIADRLELPLALHQVEQAQGYFKLLHKWNQIYNFTAVKSLSQMLERHWLDSLAIAHLIKGESIIDVGTGPGLPGMPLSIVFPTKKFCLLDSNEKRQIFLGQVVHQLKLSHVSLHCGRVECYTPNLKFQIVLSRAFKPLPELLKLTCHLLAPNGTLLAMKGTIHEAELKGIDQDKYSYEVVSLINTSEQKPKNAVLIRFKQRN